jgi:hypothetical protein
MFGIPKNNDNCLKCIDHLDIVKCNKIILYPRTLSLEIFHRLRESKIKYVMISNNIRNGLNFIHLECLTLGIPIIHNCLPYKDNGLYYEDSDRKTEYTKAVNYINEIWNNSKLNDKKGSVDILLKYHSHNKENIAGYKDLVDVLVSKEKPNIYELNNIFIKCEHEITLVEDFIILIAIDKLYDERVLKINLSKLNENMVKQKVVFYINGVILDTNTISKNNPNLDIEYINSFTDNIKVYALANVKYKYVCYLDQNTIIYMRPSDIKETLLKHKSIVSVKYNTKYGKDDDKKNMDFIDVLFRAFGKEFKEENLFDPNFFMYVNTSEIRFYYNRYIQNKKLRNFINKDFELTILMSLISNKIVLIESVKKIVTNKMYDNNFYAFGYLISCNDIVIFIKIDPMLNKNINLNTKLIVNAKNETVHNVNNVIFRNIEYDKDYVILDT